MSEVRARCLGLGLAVCLLPLAAAAENRVGTPETRGRLFDDLVRLTLEW